MRIIVIGAGIGGLSVYHALRKYLPEAEVLLYESHDSPRSTTSIIGGGLGLAPNGLRAVNTVFPGAASYIQKHGFSGGIMTFRNSAGTLLGRFRSGTKERYGFSQMLAPRALIHEAVLQDVPDAAVIWGKKVTAVEDKEDGVDVRFLDGEVETADLVIGADGVRSVTREALFGQQYIATYDGYTGIGGFIPFSRFPKALQEGLKSDPMNMTFGAQGFFGFGLADSSDPPGQVMWWSTYETATPPTRDSIVSEIYSQLLDRHASWKSPYDTPDAPTFKTIITLGCSSGDSSSNSATAENTTVAQTGLLVLPRYVCPRLPSWCSASGRVMLVGDAAHAMPSDGGQGVSCAVEDALSIALLLKHYFLGQRFDVSEAVRRTARGYEEVRIKRVGMIVDMAERRQGGKKVKSWWQEWLRDWMLWLLCKLPESINDRVFAYDVETDVASYIKSHG